MYMEFKKMVTITLYAKQKKRHRYTANEILYLIRAGLEEATGIC